MYAAAFAPAAFGMVVYATLEYRAQQRKKKEEAFESWYESAVGDGEFDSQDHDGDNETMKFDELCDRLFNADDDFWQAAGRHTDRTLRRDLGAMSPAGNALDEEPLSQRKREQEVAVSEWESEPCSSLVVDEAGDSALSSSPLGGERFGEGGLATLPTLTRSTSQAQAKPETRAKKNNTTNRSLSRLARLGILLLGVLSSAFLLFALRQVDTSPTRPIEQVQVGDRVVVDAPKEALATDVARLSGLDVDWKVDGSLQVAGIDDPLRQLAAEATPKALKAADYRKIVIRAIDEWPDGTVDFINVETLQPRQWIDAHGVHVGGEAPVPLDVVEMGLSAGLKGKVLDILPCPQIRRGPGRIVLTTVNHLNPDVCELTLRDKAGREETLRPTSTHQFYSISRGEWLAAAELQNGETLDGIDGRVTVVASREVPGIHRVYNFTVQGEHLYRVAKSGVLVHNNNCSRPATDAYREGWERIFGSGGGLPEGIRFEGSVHRAVNPKYASGAWDIHAGNIAASHRYSDVGRGALYAGTSKKAVLGELAHYDVDPAAVAWVSREVAMDNVLDLTSSAVRQKLGVSLSDLTSDNYFMTHAIGEFARTRYSGMLVPSTRKAGTSHLVVFPKGN